MGHFDTTIRITDILTIVGAVSAIVLWTGRRIINAIKRLDGFDTTIAKHGERLTQLESTVDRHGTVLAGRGRVPTVVGR